MPRSKTPTWWVQRVRTKYADLKRRDERHSAAAVVKGLVEEYGSVPGLPSERTTYRIIREFEDDLTDEQRHEYETFRWPHSMEQGALPWEASGVLLDLQNDLGQRSVPIRYARWFWRVSQALPDAEIEVQRAIAAHLSVMEIAGPRPAEDEEAVHWLMAYQPWRSAKDKEAYGKAVEAGVPSQLPGQRLLAVHDFDELVGVVTGSYDTMLAKAIRSIIETGEPGEGWRKRRVNTRDLRRGRGKSK